MKDDVQKDQTTPNEPAVTPAAPTPPASQQTNVTTPAPTPPAAAATGKPANKMGLMVVIVVLVLLLLLGLWWWMAYGQGTKNSTTPTTQPNTSTPSTESGSGGAGGAGGTGGSGGSNNTPPASSSSGGIDNLVNVKAGDSKATVQGMQGKVSPNCVTVEAVGTTPKQEVCTYVDGSKTVKVTYQDDKVVNVSNTGF